jgi:YD repeat-containing protein
MTTYQDSNEHFQDTIWPEGVQGNTTTWHYEQATGYLLGKEDATGAQVTYTYGAGGRLTTRTWARSWVGSELVTVYACFETLVKKDSVK